MAWYRQSWNVLRPGRTQRNLERELSFHVKERAEELEAGGMSAEEAVRNARRLFGNYTTQVERTREMDINGRLESALRCPFPAKWTSTAGWSRRFGICAWRCARWGRPRHSPRSWS